VHTFQPFLDAMLGAQRGALVGVASIAGFRGLPGAGAYSASKAAAIAYLESLRVEMYRTGVDVITICPGYIATSMTAKNPYRMPFLLPVDKAATLIANAIGRRRRFYVLPWQMALIGRLLRSLPRPLYDAAFARAQRKPAPHRLNAGRKTSCDNQENAAQKCAAFLRAVSRGRFRAARGCRPSPPGSCRRCCPRWH
jgi:short-subunit dehydrogenase